MDFESVSLSHIFVVAAIVVIAPLAAYAGLLLARVAQQKEAKEIAVLERCENIQESIRTIAAATAQQQVEISESVLRLYHLLSCLPTKQAVIVEAEFPALYGCFKDIEPFAWGQDRATLSKQERFQQDLARGEIESQYETKILQEIEKLKFFDFKAYQM